MTRKDASGVQTPTEQYRKQIGMIFKFVCMFSF